MRMTGERNTVRIPRFVRRPRLGRWWRRLIVAALAVAGLVVFAPATNENLDADVANLHFAAGVVIWAFAAMIPVWAAPDSALPQMRRLRRVHRRIAWRTGFLVLFASSFGLLGNAYWTLRADRTSFLHHPGLVEAFQGDAHRAAVAGIWLVCLCPLPGLAEAPLWRLWPEPVRRGLRCARAADVLADYARGVLPGYDPDRGAAGRPTTALYDHRGGRPSAEERTASLSGGKRGYAPPGPRLCWDGALLTLAEPGKPPLAVPLADRADAPAGGAVRGARLRRPVAEIVWFTERHRTVRSAPADWSTREICLVLLDARGFRVGTVRRVRDDWQPIASVARAAGVPFAAYDLGSALRDDRPRANTVLFPRRGRQLRLFAN